MKLGSIVRMSVVGLVLTAVVGGASAAAAGKKKEAPAKKAAPAAAQKPVAAGERVLFDFESDLEGWRIPEWALVKKDNALVSVVQSADGAARGRFSLKMTTKFPAKMWSGAYAEVERQPGDFMDINGYNVISASVFLPANAPKKMKGEIIMTVGEDWSWTEMRQAVELTPGKWTSVSADISNKSVAWKIPMNDGVRGDVRKLGVRVQSNYIEWAGPIYVDDVRLSVGKTK